MGISWQKSGANHVPAYQMSGIPFVTSSAPSEVNGPDSDSVSIPTKVTFPFVTKFITIRNTGINGLRVGFASDGVVAPGERRASVDVDKVGLSDGAIAYAGRNYFLIPTGSSAGGHGGSNGGSIQTFEIRCKEIYFLSDAAEVADPTAVAASTSFSLMAGLTTITGAEFPTLTGSVDGVVGFKGIG